jgi:hypothetical protein
VRGAHRLPVPGTGPVPGYRLMAATAGEEDQEGGAEQGDEDGAEAAEAVGEESEHAALRSDFASQAALRLRGFAFWQRGQTPESCRVWLMAV